MTIVALRERLGTEWACETGEFCDEIVCTKYAGHIHEIEVTLLPNDELSAFVRSDGNNAIWKNEWAAFTEYLGAQP